MTIDTKANRHAAEWKNGRIDFQPWPYPSATRFMVDNMNKTVVGGDKSFLEGLDREKVAQELVDYNFVKSACDKYPEWMNDPSVNEADPYERGGVCYLTDLSLHGSFNAAMKIILL